MLMLMRMTTLIKKCRLFEIIVVAFQFDESIRRNPKKSSEMKLYSEHPI